MSDIISFTTLYRSAALRLTAHVPLRTRS